MHPPSYCQHVTYLWFWLSIFGQRFWMCWQTFAGFLAAVSFAICATHHSSLKASPAQLVFGRDMFFPTQYVADWQLKPKRLPPRIMLVRTLNVFAIDYSSQCRCCYLSQVRKPYWGSIYHYTDFCQWYRRNPASRLQGKAQHSTPLALFLPLPLRRRLS